MNFRNEERMSDEMLGPQRRSTPRVPASSEPRPENPYRTVHARMSPPGAAWDEGFAACRAAFDAVVAERDRLLARPQAEKLVSLTREGRDWATGQALDDLGRVKAAEGRRLSHLERALKYLREFVQDGEVRRIIDAALDGEDWDA